MCRIGGLIRQRTVNKALGTKSGGSQTPRPQCNNVQGIFAIMLTLQLLRATLWKTWQVGNYGG
eukprot:7852316-Karenia_brevis.AAC.1